MSVQPVLDATGAQPGASPDEPEIDPALHVRTQLLRRVAHDIASPTGVTLTVLEEIASGDRPRPELVAMARRSLRRLMRLSENLALVAELEAGGREPESAFADARALTKQAVDDATAVDGRKDVAVATDLPASPLLVSGDGRLLTVVVREVVGNALRLASSRVAVSVSESDGELTIRVDDDGPGFAADALRTFGRRFVRRGTRGLGLSLSMATEIVRSHGGAIAVERSRLPPGRRGNVGAAVVITLPVAHARPAPRALP